MIEDAILIFILTELTYLVYKVAKLEAKLKTIEKLINTRCLKEDG